jgi:transposase InsO family protein
MKIKMSTQEARKITIIEELLKGRFNNNQASQLLNLSVRQTQRLKKEAARNGVYGILHKRRGQKPTNSLDPVIAEKIVNIYKTELSGYNFCHATDVLADEKYIFVSVSTVYRYLKASGISSPKAKRRPKKHRSRDARPCEGELAQMDASKFDWLSNGSYLQLHGAIDDATGRVLALHFEREETHDAYCELMFSMNRDDHLPKEIYTDSRSIFNYDSKKKSRISFEEELTGICQSQPNFARAMSELGILLIIARSPQAKGSIERLWGTLQDRLPKDMTRLGITSIEQANTFLKSYIPYYNRKFTVQAASPEKAYLPKCDPARLQTILAMQEKRKLDSGLAFSFYGNKYTLPILNSGIKMPASPHDIVTVAASPHIGLQVIFKGLVMKPVLLKTQPKDSLLQLKSTCNTYKLSSTAAAAASASSPWRTYSKYFYSKTNRGDIFPEQLSTSTHDILADH